jgi:hypothetical protein
MRWIVAIGIAVVVIVLLLTLHANNTYKTEASTWRANLGFLDNCPLNGCKVYIWTDDRPAKVQVSTRHGLEIIKRLAATEIASRDARDEEPDSLTYKRAYDLHIKIVTLQGKSRIINGWSNNGRHFSQRARNTPDTGAWIASFAQKRASTKTLK